MPFFQLSNQITLCQNFQNCMRSSLKKNKVNEYGITTYNTRQQIQNHTHTVRADIIERASKMYCCSNIDDNSKSSTREILLHREEQNISYNVNWVTIVAYSASRSKAISLSYFYQAPHGQGFPSGNINMLAQ